MMASQADNMDLNLGTSHLHPIPLGLAAKTKIERGDAYSAPEIFDLEITLHEVLRGPAAVKRLESQEIRDTVAEKGFELLLAHLTIGYFRRGRGFGHVPYALVAGQFAAVSGDGVHRFPLPVPLHQPAPALLGERFFPGESHQGWILFQVPEEEIQPLMIFNREYEEGVYGIWGAVWFELH
jgi:hypothetical protein